MLRNVGQLLQNYTAQDVGISRSLPCSPARAGPCFEPDEYSPQVPLYFLKIHFNSILPSTSRFSKWSLHFRLPNQNVVRFTYLPPCMPHDGPICINILFCFFEFCSLLFNAALVCRMYYSVQQFGSSQASVAVPVPIVT
jgi:hypothetical protein